jgi:hypothetical protein
MRQVIYKIFPKNYRDEEFGYGEQRQGGFVNFTPDFKFAVIETTSGEIIHVPIERFRFLHPQEE